MELSSSSPVIENCQCRGRESVSDAISAIEVLTSRQCTHYVDDLLPYEPAVTGHVVKFSFHHNFIIARAKFFLLIGTRDVTIMII